MNMANVKMNQEFPDDGWRVIYLWKNDEQNTFLYKYYSLWYLVIFYVNKIITLYITFFDRQLPLPGQPKVASYDR